MEKKYIFLMTNNSTDALGVEASKCILQSKIDNRSPTLSWLGRHSSVCAAQVCLCCDPDNVHQPPEVKWVEVTDDTDVLHPYLHHECPDQLIDPGRTTGLSENLHELANDLPENGASLDILWPFEVVKHLSLSDHTALFGGLKRLVEWHSASLHILVPDDCPVIPPGVQEWLDLLHGTVVSVHQLQDQLSSCLWRGHVNVTGTKDTKALTLPHFSLSTYQNNNIPTPQVRLQLENDDLEMRAETDRPYIPAGCLEFVSAVQLRQVPTFYITPHSYCLSVPSSSKHLAKSKLFLQKLKENPKVAYILRLRYGTRWKEALVSGRGRKQQRQKDWKELVMDNIANVTDFKQPSEVDGDVGQFQFLVRFQTSLTGGTYVAYLMRKPADFNGQVAMMLAKEELRYGVKGCADPETVTEVDAEIQELLTKLTHYRGVDLMQFNASVETVQLAALKEWIEKKRGGSEKPELSMGEWLAMLRTTRRMTLEALYQSHRFTSQRPDCRFKLLSARPEYEYDVLSQWEGVALRLHDVDAGDQISKRRSDDSLGGLAPPTGQVLTLDACEFLRHFNDDGSAVRTDSGVLRPLRSPSRRFCKYNSGDLTKSEWPDCLRARDHDVYYNCEERDAVERQCERMKTRLQMMETASTCSLQPARGPPTITIPHVTQGRATDSDGPGEADGASQDEEGSKGGRRSRSASKSQTTAKRKAESTELVSDSKRLLVERKKRQEAKMRQASQQKLAKAGSRKEELNKSSTGESRSQRHKRKLQEVVEQCIVGRGVTKDDSIYSACVNKLYMLTKCFVKDLKTSHNLRQEMEKIAESHVEQVIEFEKRIKTS